ncbi:hypothetical protein TNCV_3064381 [Trichonephila clavipes]|nr:hypothetical protein TNCV_3064381 [Trichonephila clavipes]
MGRQDVSSDAMAILQVVSSDSMGSQVVSSDSLGYCKLFHQILWEGKLFHQIPWGNCKIASCNRFHHGKARPFNRVIVLRKKCFIRFLGETVKLQVATGSIMGKHVLSTESLCSEKMFHQIPW